MTVQDLIAILSTFDPGIAVVMPGEQDEFCMVQSVFLDLVRVQDMEVMLTDESDADRISVVRLCGSDTI